MELDEAYDRIEELQFSLAGQELIDALRAESDALASGETGRAAFLNVRGEFLTMAGRHDEARSAYEEALIDGGPTVLHPLCGLLGVALAQGDESAAETLLTQLKLASRSDELDLDSYENTGEILEMSERYREALRWFNIPLRDADPEDPDPELIGVLNGHYRVRRILELPMDRFDEASVLVRETYQRRLRD